MYKELWSSTDQRALQLFELSVKHGDLAGALLAVEGAPATPSSDARSELRRLGEAVKVGAGGLDPATAIVRVLVDSEGFRGEQAAYYAPRNSFLTAVLERRRGLPILLSAVWVLVGEQAGIVVEGVGLPGHFIVRVGGPDGVLVDPFAGGQMLSVPDCKALIDTMSAGTVGWQDKFLAVTPTDGILERVLQNLVNSYQRAQEPEGLFRTARFLAALRPAESEPALVQAKMAEALGAHETAVQLYQFVLDRFPGTPAADSAGEKLHELREEPPELN
jgi:regulator of sirC expression with transglutaminase-like and TPR domain